MAVLPPHEEELELLVVGQQEVGRVGADLRTPEPFGLRRLLLQPQRGDVAVAGVEAEEEIDTGTADEASQPLELGVDARGAALAVGCTAAGIGLGAHQLLEHGLEQGAQQVGAGLLEGLAESGGKGQALVGHGFGLLGGLLWQTETYQGLGRDPRLSPRPARMHGLKRACGPCGKRSAFPTAPTGPTTTRRKTHTPLRRTLLWLPASGSCHRANQKWSVSAPKFPLRRIT